MHLEIIAAGERGHKYPTVSGTAYTGGKMGLPGWRHPVVVDLSGMRIPENIPLLTDHQNTTGTRIGMVQARINGANLDIDGQILGTSDAAAQIVAQAQAGGDWQLSIGASAEEAELVPGGSMRIVNGQEHSGPFYHVKKSVLREVSVVAVGADAGTRLKIAAHFALEMKGASMSWEEFLAERGVDPETASDEELAKLREEFDSMQGADEEKDGVKASGTAGTKPPATKTPRSVQASGATDITATVANATQDAIRAERQRVTAIQATCAGEFKQIEATAIAEGWSKEQTDAAVLKEIRASRPQTAPGMIIGGGESQRDIMASLEAATLMQGGMRGDDLIEKKLHTEKTVEAASKMRGFGLQRLLIEAAQMNGCSVRYARDDLPSVLRAAFSTTSLPGILSNVANKFLLRGFMAVESGWEKIAATRPVSDFKTVSSYRLTGDMKFQKVAPGGELKHGSLGEESYTNRARTYGRMLSITREDIINDDLSALTSVPQGLGRGAATSLNEIFWTAFMDNATFFAAGNNNLETGAGSALSIDGLTAAVTAFLNQVDGDGLPLAVSPKFLLVPNALETYAKQLMSSMQLNETTTANKAKPVDNPHAGQYEVVRSSYLSASAITGNSTTAWYLLADPLDVPTIEVAFLNGQRTPTVEQAEADFNTLGIQMRGYFDFGVSKQDYRGGVKSAGA